jgi:large subunit ribosomal protein L35
MKTNKSAAKRFHKTGTGKIMRRKAFKRHMLVNKSRKRKRNMGKAAGLFVGDEKRIKRLIPYM